MHLYTAHFCLDVDNPTRWAVHGVISGPQYTPAWEHCKIIHQSIDFWISTKCTASNMYENFNYFLVWFISSAACSFYISWLLTVSDSKNRLNCECFQCFEAEIWAKVPFYLCHMRQIVRWISCMSSIEIHMANFWISWKGMFIYIKRVMNFKVCICDVGTVHLSWLCVYCFSVHFKKTIFPHDWQYDLQLCRTR